ncbi:MAG: PHP domain-containing protein [Clostridia bacterium]|nr:PHP domain-containing protein [Clostridia bacterium]
MKVYYDFHIHSCLSPCGDNDMTPNNIVNMAVIKGLNAIAITDHNCGENAQAAIDAAEGLPLTVIPGMEIETSEEIHMVALFENVSQLLKMQDIVMANMPPIKNKPAIFGEQIIMDKHDKIIDFKEQFLITACGLNIFEITKKVRELGGVVFPAHIDKTSYSVLSNLGSIPDELEFQTVEVKACPVPQNIVDMANLNKYNILCNSDAHYLWDISEKEHYIECNSPDIKDILHNISLYI